MILSGVVFMERITPTVIKRANTNMVSKGEIVRYTINVENINTGSLIKVRLRDEIPKGLSFIKGSVNVNGEPMPTANPNTGFSLPNIPRGRSVTVTFDAMTEAHPSRSPAVNVAEIQYHYSMNGRVTGPYSTPSNDVPVYFGGGTGPNILPIIMLLLLLGK